MDRRTVRALLIEDDATDAELFREALPGDGSFDLVWVDTVAAALAALEHRGLDVVVLDLTLPDARDLCALSSIKATAPHLPVVVLTGQDNEEMALRALQNGAQDYLVKGHAERRALMRALRYAIERQRFEQERELFLSAVGHDLRNPLSAVRMAADLLLNDTALGDKARTRIGKIASSAERMNRLIEQLLSFARGRAGVLALERRPMDLVELCTLVADETELAHPDARLIVTGDGVARGSWDHDRIVQVVQNLVTNAVVHGAKGTPVHLRVFRGDEIRLEVENDGEPIPEAELKHLFHPFRRTRPRGPGLGLGLSIAHQIVSAHGGTISVRSVGRGATFTVCLPVAET